jgi:hypothetical protein
MQLNAAGQVELKLKTPWRDCNLVMSPLEFSSGQVNGCIAAARLMGPGAAVGRPAPIGRVIPPPDNSHPDWLALQPPLRLQHHAHRR